MLFTDYNDFFEKASRLERTWRENELALARLMIDGDREARQKLINSYIPVVAAFVRRVSKEMCSLEMIYRCITALEREVDTFDFLQTGESFTHRLNIVLRRELTRFIADK